MSIPLPVIVAVAIAAALALAALVVSLLALRQARAKPKVAGSPLERMAVALEVGDDENAAQELVEYLGAVHERVENIQAEVVVLRERSRHPLQKLGMVRFDAADDISGGMSCALAALDAGYNGFILTTLYTRERCRGFVRKLTAGKTDYELLDEEAEALQEALNG